MSENTTLKDAQDLSLDDVLYDLEEGIGLEVSDLDDGEGSVATEQPPVEETELQGAEEEPPARTEEAEPPSPEEPTQQAQPTEEQPPQEGSEAAEDPVFELEGEKYTAEQLREWRDSGLRWDDYTRKTQELAEARREAEGMVGSYNGLLEEITEDPTMKDFIRVYPKILPRLLANPRETKAILGNEKAIRSLWSDYATVADNPRLEGRFLTGRRDAAREQEEFNQQQQFIDSVGKRLVWEVDEMAKKYPGVDTQEVQRKLSEMAGLPQTEADIKATPYEKYREGFERLFGQHFVQDGGQVTTNPRLLEMTFKEVAWEQSRSGDSSPSLTEEQKRHNEATERKLQGDVRGATPGGGGPAIADEDYSDWTSEQVLEYLEEL